MVMRVHSEEKEPWAEALNGTNVILAPSIGYWAQDLLGLLQLIQVRPNL